MDVIAPIALLAAIAAGIAAAYMLWTGQNALQKGRGALFNTERQVAFDQARRSNSMALGLLGVAAFLLLIRLIGGSAGGVITQPTTTPNRKGPPPTTLAPGPPATFAATLLPTPTATPPLARAVVVNAGVPGLRLRETPNGNEIDFLPDGIVLELFPEPTVTTDDGITWQKVRDPQGRVGWVATAYIANQ